MTPQEHYEAAENLLDKAHEVYAELKAVPVTGLDIPTAQLENGEVVDFVHISQSTRRDALGKQMAGLYHEAQVHAALAAAPDTYVTNIVNPHTGDHVKGGH